VSHANPTNLTASIRQRLLNLSRQRNEEFQFILIRFGLERLMYRLGRSPHRGRFVLKGAMLFQLWTGQPHRSTLDLDLLADADETVAHYEDLIRDVCVLAVEDDGLRFPPETVRGEAIREDQQYKGVRIHAVAMLGAARIPVQIDIGFGDVVTPRACQVEYPTLLELPAPVLKAYPMETVVAEKYEAMVSLGIANSRMKDFYDLWVLLNSFPFDGAILAKAIKATFARRRTPLPDSRPIALTAEFAHDIAKRAQWTAFVKRGRLATETLPLDRVITAIADFLWSPTVALLANTPFNDQWTPDTHWVEKP
jgi:hypothetical protein